MYSNFEYIDRAIKCYRKREYYKEKINNKLYIIPYLIYKRKCNKFVRYGNIGLGGKIGNDLKIWHNNIIINEHATIGNNCELHGNNCIGGKGVGDAPTIGNNVHIGYGATIIGDIYIADDITIGANSLVNKSFMTKGITIAGNPACELKTK